MNRPISRRSELGDSWASRAPRRNYVADLRSNLVTWPACRATVLGMTVVKQVAVSIAVAVITVAVAEYVAWVLGQGAP